MARSLLIADPENAIIEELKQVSRMGSNETATRCSAIQLLLAGADRQLVCKALLVTNRALRKWINRWQPMYLPPYSPDLNPIERIWLTMKARWFNNHVCKNEEKLLERLDQAILDVIDNPEKTQQTTAIGTLF
jgi:transposase